MFRRITALNNHGVESMKYGRFQEAIYSFRHALDCLQNASTDVNGIKAHGVEVLQQPQHQPLQVISTPLECLNHALVLSISPHNIFEVYQCAFTLSPGSSSKHTITETMMVVVYNLGLAHHLVVLSWLPAHALQDHLKEALRCYKIAASCFRSCRYGEEYGSGAFMISSLTLVLGLLNNLGHTLAHFFNYTEARKCGMVLEDLMDPSRCSHMLPDNEGDFFFLTLSFIQVPTTTSAPAA